MEIDIFVFLSRVMVMWRLFGLYGYNFDDF